MVKSDSAKIAASSPVAGKRGRAGHGAAHGDRDLDALADSSRITDGAGRHDLDLRDGADAFGGAREVGRHGPNSVRWRGGAVRAEQWFHAAKARVREPKGWPARIVGRAAHAWGMVARLRGRYRARIEARRIVRGAPASHARNGARLCDRIAAGWLLGECAPGAGVSRHCGPMRCACPPRCHDATRGARPGSAAPGVPRRSGKSMPAQWLGVVSRGGGVYRARIGARRVVWRALQSQTMTGSRLCNRVSEQYDNQFGPTGTDVARITAR